MISGMLLAERMPAKRMTCPTAMPNRPMAQTLRLEVSLQNHGRKRTVTREMASIVAASDDHASWSGALTTYWKKNATEQIRAMNPIQKKMLLPQMIIHGQLPLV